MSRTSHRENILGAGAIPVVAGLFFLCAVLGLAWVGVQMAAGESGDKEKMPYLYEEYILRAKAFERMGRDREAFGYFRMAIDAAPNASTRANAGLAISAYLLNRAVTQPRPFALMAKQYLEAVLDLTKDPKVLYKAYNGIARAGFLLEDLPLVSEVGEPLLALAPDTEAASKFLVEWMDLCLRVGTMQEMQKLLTLAAPYEDTPYWDKQFALRKLRTDSRILMDEAWGEEFFGAASDMEKPLLRESLYDMTMAGYADLAETGDSAMTDECLYQMAALAVSEGEVERGRDYINDFLLREPDQYLDEALLLMAKIARLQGRSQNADQMITRFLQRYGMKAGATGELLLLLDQMEQEGRVDEALKLTKVFLQYPLEPSMYPAFVARAAHLAAMGGHYLEGEKYMDELLTMNVDQALVSRALLEQADACIASKAYRMAEKWLLKHLERYPDDPLQGECLFKLYDVKQMGGGQVTDIMLAGMAAIDEAPSDIRSMQTLIDLAHMLEDLGLYNLAQVQYSKVGLLRMTASGRNRAESDVMGQAVLGSARCLLKMG
ncbi:MAG: hypothetical protein EOM20_19865, partial [Spartobacteria bacterium]|nr:hypothetical protein [Spartobacteria bacterium]